MKTIISISLLFVLAGMYSSCSLFDKLDDAKFNAEFTLTFFVNETEVNPSGKAYFTEQWLNITDDPDVEEFADKIKEVKVNRISYFIYGINKSGVTASDGELSITPSRVIASLPDESLIEGISGDLVIDQDGFTELGKRLKANKSELIGLGGNLSETPMSFFLEATFYVTVTAEALK